MTEKDFFGSGTVIDSAEDKDVQDFLSEVSDKMQVDEDSGAEDTEGASETPQGLAAFVREAFDRSDSARKTIEEKWLNALRQYKGIYSPEVLERMDPLRSKAFVRMTRTKVKTVDSRLSDLLFPANGDKNWGIEPTPLPQFSKKKEAAILEVVSQDQGKQISPEELYVLMQDEAKNQAGKMSKVIEDQLAELKYREIMRDVMHSGNLYGTGILKGPLVSISENRQYYKKEKNGDKEKWILCDYDSITPFIENVRIWDIYPDMEATCPSECRYIIQRRKMDKHDVIGLGKRSDFNGDVISTYVAENPEGDYQKKDFENQLTSMGDVIDSGVADAAHSKKYEVFEFWGFVDADDLNQVGVEIPERMQGQVELAANIWVLGDHVIKASLMPMEGVKWPYFFYYYDKDETSIFGEGIPSIMSDVQELINSAFRAMLDNAAISAGPQIEVNLDLMSEDEDPRDVYPFKVWMRTGEGADAANPAIRVFQLPSYTTEFERMIELFRSYGDEVTSIPRQMWGEPSGAAGRTASGLSMLMGSANITIKDQVKNFDDGITKPFISAMYHWNMKFNSDADIKGDYAVQARGTSSLIAKEIRAQSLINFAQITNNQVDLGTVKRPNIIRSIADALDLSDDNLVYSDKEIEVQKQQEQKQAQEERQWMTDMVETARSEGVSPAALIDSLRQLREDMSLISQPEQAYPQS